MRDSAFRLPLFPFWIAVKQDSPRPICLAAPESRYAAAFIWSESARAYIHGQSDSTAELHLVSRATFGEVAKLVRGMGLSGLCFEPDMFGRGERITVAQ